MLTNLLIDSIVPTLYLLCAIKIGNTPLPSKSAQCVQYYRTGKTCEIITNKWIFVKITLALKKNIAKS